jgi:hypothetical protein
VLDTDVKAPDAATLANVLAATMSSGNSPAFADPAKNSVSSRYSRSGGQLRDAVWLGVRQPGIYWPWLGRL